MKKTLLLVLFIVLGYFTYQFFSTNSSVTYGTKQEQQEQKASHKHQEIKQSLKDTISALPLYKKGSFTYGDIRCFDDETYGVSCKITDIALDEKQAYASYFKEIVLLKFDLTLFGIGKAINSHTQAIDLSDTVVGLSVDNLDFLTFISDQDTDDVIKYIGNNLSYSVFMTPNKALNERIISFRTQVKDEFSFLTTMRVGKDNQTEKLMEKLLDCFVKGCEKTSPQEGLNTLLSHLYLKEMTNDITVTQKFINKGTTKIQRDGFLWLVETDDNILPIYKRKLRQLVTGKINHTQDKISAKEPVSLLQIWYAWDNGEYFFNSDTFFKDNFEYAVDGEK